MKRRIVAFVDHEIGRRLLEKIISIQGQSEFVLVAVVTTSENGQLWWPGITDLCEKGGVPLIRYSDSISEILDRMDIDWYFLLSWKYILPPLLLNRPRYGAINLHYSLLPEYRGVYPVNWAIIEGKKVSGITYHLVNEKIDGGQIIFQKEAPIYLSDTARSLQLRLDNIAVEVFDDVVRWIVHGARPNKNTLNCASDREGSYRSRANFIETNEVDLFREYRALDFLNLLRGKTFRPETKSLYCIDPESGKRVYISISLALED